MLPDMADTLDEWSMPYTIKTVTRTTVDFVEADIVAGRTVACVVQPAQKEKLNPDQIDWSLKYLQVHAAAQLNAGEFIEFQGADYKFIEDGDYQLYGFSEVIAEQTKRPPLEVTP